jgi:hypothetical protein
MRFSYLVVLGLSITLSFTASSAQQPISKAGEDAKAAAEFRREMSDAVKRRRVVFLSQMALGQMGFGTGPFNGDFDDKTKKAIAAFRHRIGLADTDDPLDYEFFVRVTDALNELNQPNVLLGRVDVDVSRWLSDVRFEGTVIIEGEEPGIPLQHSEFHCRKDINTCIEASAMLQGGNFLTAWLEYYDVDRWDDVELVMRRDLGCVRYTLRVSKSQKTVSGLRATTSNAGFCKGMDTDDKRLKLVDGLEAIKSYNKKRHDAFVRYVQADISVIDEKPPTAEKP